MIIELPNGIQDTKGEWTKTVEIDEMTGQEEDILMDQARDEGGKGTFKKSGPRRVTEILSRCTVAIGDDRRPEGRNRFNAPAYFEKVWKDAFSTDRNFAMVRIRQLTLGPKYTFEKNCPSCRKVIENVTIDLASLDVRSIPLEAVKGEHELTLPRCKDIVTWRMLTGAHEDLTESIMDKFQSSLVSALIMMKIKKVSVFVKETESYDPPSSPPGGLEYLRRLSSADRRFLTHQFDLGEGSIDTEIKITCPNSACRREFTTRLEVMDPSFFFPSETPSSSSRTSSSSESTGTSLPTPSQDFPSLEEGG